MAIRKYLGRRAISGELGIPAPLDFESLANDGFLYWANNPIYVNIWAAAQAQYIRTALTYLTIGQCKAGIQGYSIWRSFLYFDTSTLAGYPDITSAKISIWLITDNSATNFNVTIQNGQPTYPHLPLVLADYAKGHYSDDGGSLNTSTFTGAAYYDINLNSLGISWINKTGNTKLCVRSDREIAGTQPSGLEQIYVGSSEHGNPPILHVEFE